MSPEVAKEKPYNKTVDVYSFGIMLWELCTAEKPFYGYSGNKHMQQVVLGGERPRMDRDHTAFWPPNLQWLMKRCWSACASTRPSFTEIKQVLQDVLDDRGSIPEGHALCSERDISEGTLDPQEPSEDNLKVEPPSPGAIKAMFRPLSRGGSLGNKGEDLKSPQNLRRNATEGMNRAGARRWFGR
jgi:serine/threonine protein kinase